MPPLNRPYSREDSLLWEYPTSDLPKQQSILCRESLRPLRRKRKHVTFNEFVATRTVLARSDYTPQEKMDSYLSAEDFEATRINMGETLYLIRNEPQLIDDESYTVRGMECRLKDVTKRRHQMRAVTRTIVMNGQKIQRGCESLGEDWVARTYAQTARAAVMESLQVAAQDAIDAQRYQEACTAPDMFSDEWITSLFDNTECNSMIPPSPCILSHDASGFNDSWLRDGSTEAIVAI